MSKQNQKRANSAPGGDLSATSSVTSLQTAIVNTIEELKFMYSGVPYDVKVAIEKNVDYLYRTLRESGYNI